MAGLDAPFAEQVAAYLAYLASQRRASAHTLSNYRRELLRLIELAGGLAPDALGAPQIRGFAGPEGQMVGVETRTSSPVRITRVDEGEERALQSATVAGLYPCGEGAGFAGGIVSAALDGKRVAAAIAHAQAPTA